MNKMLLCTAVALAGITAGCASQGPSPSRNNAEFGEPSPQYRDVTYVEYQEAPVVYREVPQPEYREVPRTEYRVYTQPSTTTTIQSNDDWKWDGLTLGQRYQRERQGR
jgi:hypothetical protein